MNLQHKQRSWLKLDNAALIYPATQSRNWHALFRLSATLIDTVDPVVLQQAVDKVIKRFPGFACKLKKGLFWFYLEHINEPLLIQKDVNNPCVKMDFKENNGYMLRVRYYENRIAVEYFHVLTDGTGGLCFLNTLVAEYLTIKYGENIPRDEKILNCDDTPKLSELEDSFPKYARGIIRSRSETDSYRIKGTVDKNYLNVVTSIIDSNELISMAKNYNATVTEFLVAVLIKAIDKLQASKVENRRKFKPIKICVPINLRAYYPTTTLRNFSSYINPGIEPKYGEYSLEEIIRMVKGFMLMERDEKLLNAKFSTNVADGENIPLRLTPLFLKNLVLRLVYQFVGDRQTSSCISNLGKISLPDPMNKYVTRMDFLLGPFSLNRAVMGCCSYKNSLIINFTRTIKEADIVRLFNSELVKLGIHVKVESNQR